MSDKPRNRSTNNPEESDKQRIVRLEAQLETYRGSLAEIYELYDHKIEELSIIRRVGDSIRTPLDMDSLCRAILDAVAQEISVDRLALFLYKAQADGLYLRAEFTAFMDQAEYHEENEQYFRPLDESPLSRAAGSGRPLLLSSATGDLDPINPDSRVDVSLIFLPLIARDELVGVITLSRQQDHPFEENDVRILTIIADQSATALANVRLFDALAQANRDLRASEQQARQTTLYLENLLETANDVIFTLDDSGSITYVNRKIEEWGYDKDELPGRSFETLSVDTEDEPSLFDRIGNKDEGLLDTVLKTGRGERRNVLLSSSRLDPSEGHGATRLVLVRDITEMKHLEKQLFHSDKLASIGILAAGVAHEVGNPLFAISGYSQLLLAGGMDEAVAREYLEAIIDQTARIQRIIQELLNYSRPSTGNRSIIDMVEAIPSILSMLTHQKTFRDLDIRFEPEVGYLLVSMDRDHLAQIIINIALNAAQAMPQGGSLVISLNRREGEAEVRLVDDGPGIPQEQIERVFDPFFTTKPVGQGTGLGLAICHRIVESYNGSIELESRPGQGAAFTLRFPLATERTASA